MKIFNRFIELLAADKASKQIQHNSAVKTEQPLCLYEDSLSLPHLELLTSTNPGIQPRTQYFCSVVEITTNKGVHCKVCTLH